MRFFSSTWRRDLVLLFCGIGLLFAIGLNARPYLTPSEARYIELPRQMVATGDWMTPRINGVPYFEKPPLFYWLQASVIKFFGDGEIAGRLMIALIMTLTCLTIYITGRALYGRLPGLLAAMALATSLLGYALSRAAMLDVPVTLFITLCLASFLAAQQEDDKNQRRNFYLLMYVASALAVMTKGLIGMVIPALIIGAWILFTRRWRILLEAQLPIGVLIFLALAAPWHLWMANHHPEFLDFYFIHEHFTRYLTDEHKRTEPWWFFIAVAAAGWMPWTGLLPSAFRQVHRREPFDIFLVLWVVLPLIFFSTSHSKLVPYIFPIFPPLAIMLGRVLAEYWQEKLADVSLRRNVTLVVLVFTVLVLFCQLLPTLPGKLGHKLAFIEYIPPLWLLPIGLAIALLWFSLVGSRPAKQFIMALAVFGITTNVSLNFIAARLDSSTIKPLADALLLKLHDEDMVVAYGSYWQDLPVYLNRNVTVAGWTGELNFGVTHYPQTQEWMISIDEFWKRCAVAPHGVYVVMAQASYAKLSMPASCRLHTIASYGKNLLLEKEHP